MSFQSINKNEINYTKILKRMILYAIMIISSVMMVVPLLWMVSASFKPEIEIFKYPIDWIPDKIILDNYIEIWTENPFGTYFTNTIKTTVTITLLQLITCSLAGYSFSRIEYPGRDKIFFLYLSTLMIPYQVIMIPQFFIIKHLGLVNNLLSVIVIQSFSAFGVFLFRQFFLTIPKELSESATIDGCTELQIYWKIILPLAKSAIGSLVIFTFIYSWNDFLGPLIYLNTEESRTLQVGIRSLMSDRESKNGVLMAAATCAIVPIIIVFIAAQDYFVEGIATSGLKG